MPQQSRAGARRVQPSFRAREFSLRQHLNASRVALTRSTAVRHRLEAQKARTDMREWQVKRRERTRQLIELGGLVVKAGLVDLADDDRAALYGAFLTLAERLHSEDESSTLALWQRKGKRAFDAEEAAKASPPSS